MTLLPYRILSIDGGGIRGLLPIVLLQRLSQHPKLAGIDWIRGAQLVSGTSTGGLIALGIAHRISLETLRGLYENGTKSIFQDSKWDNVRDLGSVRAAQYATTNLEQTVRELAGDTRLCDLAMRVLIPAFDLDNEAADPNQRAWHPKLFHNIPGQDQADMNTSVVQVALYTTAGPTYFPVVDGYADGMIFANNPSMCALVKTQDPRNHVFDRPDLSRVMMLSLGTGEATRHIKGKSLDWGKLQWARPIVEAMTDAQTQIVHQQCQMLLNERYYRVSPKLPSNIDIGIDDVQRVPELLKIANSINLEPIVHWIFKYWLGRG